MSKHTPGPWEATNGTVAKSGTYIDDGDEYNTTQTSALVAFVVDWDDPKGEANARLIAAAPELLSVLEDCEMWLAELKGTEYDSEGAVTAQLDEIRAAIAKARGEG